MKQKRVVITVEADGHVHIDAQNFQGKGCQQATEAIAIALGGNDRDKSDDQRKPEFFQSVPTTNVNRV